MVLLTIRRLSTITAQIHVDLSTTISQCVCGHCRYHVSSSYLLVVLLSRGCAQRTRKSIHQTWSCCEVALCFRETCTCDLEARMTTIIVAMAQILNNVTTIMLMAMAGRLRGFEGFEVPGHRPDECVTLARRL